MPRGRPDVIWAPNHFQSDLPRSPTEREPALSQNRSRYTPEQAERLRQIHSRVIEARRELDALIGDAYLRPRASIVPVHFLDLASAVEKLRWAEKEWRELDREVEEGGQSPVVIDEAAMSQDLHPDLVDAAPSEGRSTA